MATGNQMLPGAQVTAEPAMTAEPEAGPTAWQATQDSGHEPPPRLRRGAGGRWSIWVLRAVVWVVVLLIGYRGVSAIVTSYAGSGSATPKSGGAAARPAGAAGRGFPVALAQAYALQFGQVYLNFSPATAARRATELAQFLAPGADPELGWNGAGTRSLQSEQVASVVVRSPHSAIVILLIRANDELSELGVPIYAAHGGLVVSGLPALLPPPPTAVPPTAPKAPADQAVRQSLGLVLPDFFRAFASSDTAILSGFAAPGVHLSGLGGVVSFGSIQQVSVPAEGGPTRHVTVTVMWISPAGQGGSTVSNSQAQIDMTYSMNVIRHGGKWLVQSIAASAVLAGPPS
jgi:hypothetical protein